MRPQRSRWFFLSFRSGCSEISRQFCKAGREYVTALTFFAGELAAKRLQFLKEIVQGLDRIGLLVNPNNYHLSRPYMTESQVAAAKLGLVLQTFEASMNWSPHLTEWQRQACKR
jgi:hypothetical protein